jgi:hypothetical protein
MFATVQYIRTYNYLVYHFDVLKKKLTKIGRNETYERPS